MKKLLSVLLLCLLLFPARAQEPEWRYNEIGVSGFAVTGLQAAGVAVGGLYSFIGTLFRENDIYFVMPIPVPLSIEYDHWFNDIFAAGLSLNADMLSFLPEGAVGNFSVMPDIKLSWLRDEKVRVYSKVAAGYSTTLLYYTDDITGKPGIIRAPFARSLSSNLIGFMITPSFGIQINPLCIDVHTAVNNLDFCCEFGFGTLGMASFGFKTYF